MIEFLQKKVFVKVDISHLMKKIVSNVTMKMSVCLVEIDNVHFH